MTGPVEVARLLGALHAAGLLVSTRGVLPQTVSAITDDSRHVVRDALFLAVRGVQQDGHDFLPAAEQAGATLALVADPTRTELPALVVREARRAAAVCAAAFYGEPARSLRFVGVTGTNGKTTTVGMLRHLLDAPGVPAASIGTLGVLVGSTGEALAGGAGLTTPGPVELQRVLRTLVDAGVRTVAMETSSHALHQRRVDGIPFAAGVFTNLTRDHLDYHGTLEEYFAAKALLVGLLSPSGAAVVNADDPAWRALPEAPRTVRFARHTSAADVRAERVEAGASGSRWTLRVGVESHPVKLPLCGDFNVDNALAAAAAAWVLGVAPRDAAARLSSLPQVAGRLERILDRPTVLRDYAHTPDALERALRALRPFTAGRLLLVFGCGGDRDRGKRPDMGRIAETLADRVFVTSDNPRTEDPERILDEIESGMRAARHVRITDREDAIARAMRECGPDDVLLLAGKGHETYQIRGTTRYPFDERQIVTEIAERLH